MVKIDIHKGELFYEQMTLSDPNVIKLLIKYRYKYDPYYMIEQERHFDVAGDVKPLNQEAIALYAALDETIKKCRFKKRQLDLLRYVEMGYEFADIRRIDDRYSNYSLSRMFDSIINKIAGINKYEWKIYIHKNYLDTEFKQCNKCKRELPRNHDFFTPDARNEDGLFGFCKMCRKSNKK